MKVELYDKVKLTNGQIASVVEILGDYEAYIVDAEIDGDYDTITVLPDRLRNFVVKILTFYYMYAIMYIY